MRRIALLAPAVLVLAAACSTGQAADPAPSAVPSPTATPGPTASPAPVVTPLPSPVVDPSPVVTPAPVITPAPTKEPAPAMTKREQKLVASLRPDVAVNCVSRRTNLPKGAVRAIECFPDDPLVARVGVYEFASMNEAAYAYMTRMASAGVDVNAGDCNRDKPGEQAWMAGDGEANYDDPGVFNWENEALMPERIGCFVNEAGVANVRATCGDTYVGVLGKGKDLSDLTDWTWAYPQGYEAGTPDSPGICVNGR